MKPPAELPILFTLNEERCQECTHCLRTCPTEAIRIRKGKAEIMAHRCVQCGNCLRVCPRGAWEVQGDPLKKIFPKGPALALLDSTVFGQFGGNIPPGRIVEAFLQMGFAAAQGSGDVLEIYERAILDYLSSSNIPRPAISSACPVLVQLIQVKYPSLVENLIPLIFPFQIAARRQFLREQGEGKRKNFYYIVPCPALAGAAQDPFQGGEKIAGAIPFRDLYGFLKAQISRPSEKKETDDFSRSSLSQIGWAASGWISETLGIKDSLVVDGLAHAAAILDLTESGRLEDVPFVEAWACPGGCVGGPFTVLDPFLARFYLQKWVQHREKRQTRKPPLRDAEPRESYRVAQAPRPRPGLRLDENLKVAMEKLRQIDALVKKLPGIDCGSCGCPNCLAFAEDIVQGHARMSDCLYVLKKALSPEGLKTGGRNQGRDEEGQS